MRHAILKGNVYFVLTIPEGQSLGCKHKDMTEGTGDFLYLDLPIGGKRLNLLEPKSPTIITNLLQQDM